MDRGVDKCRCIWYNDNITQQKDKTMNQVFYMPENSFETFIADVSDEYLVEFSKGKIIIKIIRY